MPVFPGDAAPTRTWDAHPERGDTDEVSRWILGAHTGTHVDAPRHFFRDGADVEALGIDPFVGPVRVVDLTHADRVIDAAALRHVDLAGAERVLLRTRNSLDRTGTEEFDTDYIAIAADGAVSLVAAGLRTVGVDYLSVDRYPDSGDFDFPAHRELLGAGLAVIEGLDLSAAPEGDHFLCCLPLRLLDGEASPARALLFVNPTPSITAHR